MKRALTVAAQWLAGEPLAIRSRRLLMVVLAASVGSLAYAWRVGAEAAHPLTHAKPLPALPPDHGDVRFGVPLAKRKDVFRELADQEPSSRAEGKKSFPGADLAWSAEDHRGAYERKSVAAAMAKHGLTMTQVYLILDEGIREKWTGSDGQPLTPLTVPLHPRRKYGW